MSNESAAKFRSAARRSRSWLRSMTTRSASPDDEESSPPSVFAIPLPPPPPDWLVFLSDFFRLMKRRKLLSSFPFFGVDEVEEPLGDNEATRFLGFLPSFSSF